MDIIGGTYYYGQVSCIDRQIAELEARRDALIHGYCYTGYIEPEPFRDPYNLFEMEKTNAGKEV